MNKLDVKIALDKLSAMSNKYGADPEFVLAGGGNTSFKTSDVLFVKSSGTSLADIKPEEFVRMDRSLLAAMWETDYPEDEAARESAVLADMMDSRLKNETRRPSVEALLHDMFPQSFVLHVHPAQVNSLTCAVGGEAAAAELFPDAVWISACKPGYILALECRKAATEYAALNNGNYPNLVFLENHGVFIAAETTEEIDILTSDMMTKIEAKIIRKPDFSTVSYDIDHVVSISPVIRMIYGSGQTATVKFVTNKEILAYDPLLKSFTPDHIVYYKAKLLVLSENITPEKIKPAFDRFVLSEKYKPRIIYIRDLGAFICGDTLKEVKTAEALFIDAIKISVYCESFGGASPMSDDLIEFIVNWEVENYRSSVSLSEGTAKRLSRKIAVVTGAAQGFGLGIAKQLAEAGAYVVFADMNYPGVKSASADTPESSAVEVNVTDEESVKSMIDLTVLEYGGIDIFINNAGVVKAGSLDEMTKQAFDFVTDVNYTGYFLCAKYASKIMKIQHSYASDYYMDIIEINSKSGLVGSNKNFAYAGSKFGGIGLTQSFALELAEYRIKVNAICPGNFLDGPLWSDPEKGLFVQYLKAGKVPGAKTVDDVRKSYEDKVPLGRGCEIVDVVRAIFYIAEQEYETGQAIPVTGGQEMLK